MSTCSVTFYRQLILLRIPKTLKLSSRDRFLTLRDIPKLLFSFHVVAKHRSFRNVWNTLCLLDNGSFEMFSPVYLNLKESDNFFSD